MKDQIISDSLVIREATSSDIPQMKVLIFTHGPNPWNYLPEADVVSHMDGVSSGQTLGLLAFSGSELVGLVTFTECNPFARYEPADANSAESGYIAEAVVAKSMSGRGLGSRLLIEACRKLGSLGKRRVYVDRHEENAASAGMMRKAGFYEVETFADPKKRSVGSRRTVVCRCDL